MKTSTEVGYKMSTGFNTVTVLLYIFEYSKIFPTSLSECIIHFVPSISSLYWWRFRRCWCFFSMSVSDESNNHTVSFTHHSKLVINIRHQHFIDLFHITVFCKKSDLTIINLTLKTETVYIDLPVSKRAINTFNFSTK